MIKKVYSDKSDIIIEIDKETLENLDWFIHEDENMNQYEIDPECIFDYISENLDIIIKKEGAK